MEEHEASEGFSLPPYTPRGRVRQPRTVYSVEQREELERFFENNQYPSYDERETLAARLNLQEQQVQVWFKNRRAKYRKMHEATQQQSQAAAPLTQGPGVDVPAPAASAPGFSGDASAPGFSGDASAPGFSGDASAPGFSGSASAPGFSGDASAPGFSGDALAPGFSGDASAPGFSGDALAPGFSGDGSAPGFSGSASVPGFSGDALAPGFSGSASAPGFSGDGSAPGFSGVVSGPGISGDAKAPGEAAFLGDPGFYSPPPPNAFGGVVVPEISASNYMQAWWGPTQDAQNPVPAAATAALAPAGAPVWPEEPYTSGFCSDLLEGPTLADLLSSQDPLEGPSSLQSGYPEDEESGGEDDSSPKKFLDL